MSRKNRIAGIEPDPRTETMTNTALECRDVGHAWARVPMGPKRRLELARLGQVEKIQVCDRGCGTEKTQIIDVVERTRVGSPRSRYGEGYRITGEYAGSGRLPRMDAFIASLVRSGEL